jgi:hypothetical protein
MLAFTFEIIRHGEEPLIANVLTPPDERAIWCQVEALALQIRNCDGASIRVKNAKGETVIRTGVATALASIEKCSCKSCPLKRGLERRFSLGDHAAIERRVDFAPCRTRGRCSCKVGGLSKNVKALSLSGDARQ